MLLIFLENLYFFCDIRQNDNTKSNIYHIINSDILCTFVYKTNGITELSRTATS